MAEESHLPSRQELMAEIERLRTENASQSIRIVELEHLAFKDPLTGANTRRVMEEELRREGSTYSRKGRDFALILFDIDHFKQFNDRFGHEVGDKVLKLVSSVISRILRPSDVFARWGGEEFVALLPDTDPKKGSIVAERIRSAVEAVSLEGCPPITVSVGLAYMSQVNDLDSLVKAADRAMYYAKESGRNKVCDFSSIPPERNDNLILSSASSGISLVRKPDRAGTLVQVSSAVGLVPLKGPVDPKALKAAISASGDYGTVMRTMSASLRTAAVLPRAKGRLHQQ